MPRIILRSWWCRNNHRNEGSDEVCTQCGMTRREKHAQPHASERAVVYENPRTGEMRTPPRADAPMPEVYARQGYERREIMSMSAFEKETGKIHEATNFNPGNETVGHDGSPADPASPKLSKEVKEALAKDIAAAAASGPWTGGLPGAV